MSPKEAAEEFIRALRSSGGSFHDSLQVNWDESRGVYICCTTDIEGDSTLISVPFEKAITRESGVHALESVDGYDAKKVEGWNERMMVASYLLIRWAKGTSNVGGAGSSLHERYIDALPPVDTLRTPLFWTAEERDLLEGTNLAGTVRDQEKERKEEYERIRELIHDATWEQYLAATAYISSRAFPSRLLSLPSDGSSASTKEQTTASGAKVKKDEMEGESYPVLIPGLDLFNHSRGTPITWLSSPFSGQSGSIPSVSFQTPQSIPANSEVFNNYGPKSNEELLLSYGFVMDDNPDDTLILRLGVPDDLADRLKEQGLDVKRRFVLRRDGEVPQDLLKVMRGMMGQNGHVHGSGCGHDHANGDGDEGDDEDEDEHAAYEKEMEEMQLEMDVLGTLGGMLEDKLEKLLVEVSSVENVREDVRRMCQVYRQGQIDIIQKTQDVLESRIERLEGMVDQGMGGCPCGC